MLLAAQWKECTIEDLVGWETTTAAAAVEQSILALKRTSLFVILLDGLTSDSHVSLLDQAELDALALGEGDQGLLALTDHEDVAKTGGESVATGVLNVGDLVGSRVVLNVLQDAHSADIVSADNEHGSTVLELDESVNLVALQVKLHQNK